MVALLLALRHNRSLYPWWPPFSKRYIKRPLSVCCLGSLIPNFAVCVYFQQSCSIMYTCWPIILNFSVLWLFKCQIFIKFHVWQDVIFSACVWPAKPLVFHSLQGHCNYNNNNNPVVPYTMTVTLWYLLMVIIRWLVLLSPLSEHCSCPRLSAVSWTDNLNTHCTFAARHWIADGCENRKSWGTYQL